jgi:ankyrin repeat protein
MWVEMRGSWLLGMALCLTPTAAAQSTADDLFQAIRNNDLAALKVPLAPGADVNSRDKRDNTLLMQAAAFGSPEAVKLLLERGADVNAANAFDNTALILGANDPEKAVVLVNKGADVNARTKQGRTALMIAAACDGCSQTVRLLIGKAADLQGSTAVHGAAGSDLDSLRLLLASGADPDASDKAGDTPLQAAAGHCNADAVKLLLSKGAKVDAKNTDGGEVKFGRIQLVNVTSLMWAAPYCNEGVIKPLLDAGANVNAKDIREMTPLMLAVASENQDLDVVRLLLKAGAEVNAKNTTGETALDWARKFGNRKVIAALTAAGAKGGAPLTPPQRTGSPKPLLQAVETSTSLLERNATGFFQQSGCVGCHHQPFTSLAVAAVRGRGIRFDDAAAAALIKMSESQWTTLQEVLLERNEIGGVVDQPLYSLLAMAAEHYAPNNLTDTLVSYIAGFQSRDGAWRVGGSSRAPMEESSIARTALAMHALQVYGIPGRRAEFDQRIARAGEWLVTAKPETTDDTAMLMVGLHWAGAGAGRVKSVGRTLMATQRPDGGWAPNPNLASDAYATGESLWAFQEAAVMSIDDPASKRGINFLLSTQFADGSWYVRSRAVKFQPYFQSGSPFDHDQWISATATAWAVRAMAPAIPNEKPTPR